MSRQRVRDLVEDPRFQNVIIGVIVLNAITLGCETSRWLTEHYGATLHLLDRAALAVFVVELLLRLYGHGWRFFTDPWGVFDFTIVTIALVPASGPFSVLRALRILRALRLVSAIPSMRRVVSSLLAAMPGMASIGMLLSLIVYVSGVMATKLFRETAPEYFGSFGKSLFSLFQIMTTEGWADIARQVMADQPWAWVFFVVYLLTATFTTLNLFIAVVVNAMEHEVADEMKAEVEEHQREDAATSQRILDELRALRAEVAQLRASTAEATEA
ncbi:MAG: ion transporter [Micromonosporaceae bacterium]